MENPRSILITAIAIACHQANKAWCQVNGDDSQKDWTYAEEWQRESALKGVEFRINNPNSGHDAQHNSWMQEKITQGWVYGETKDAALKIHPCIVPFSQLPEFQQKKDALFCAIVDSLRQPAVNEQTFGQKLVGLSFNPSGDDRVGKVKQLFADVLDAIGDPAADTERRSYSYNIIRTQAVNTTMLAQMAVVKFLTWRE